MELGSTFRRAELPFVFLVVLFLLVFLAGFPPSQTQACAEDLSSVEIHGFLSQGFINTTSNNYLTNSSLGSFDFTEAGLNFTKQLDDNIRTGMQLFVQRLGPTEDFTVKLDWFYLDYRISDLLGIRFGRVKIPFGLYNDIVDIDSARAPILLPQSIYPESNENYLLAQTGVELYGYTGRNGPAGGLEYRIYAGTISFPVTNTPGAAAQIQGIDVPYVVGGRIMWETPVDGLKVGGTVQSLLLNTTLLINSATVSDQIPALFWVGSIEYNKQNLLLAAEYSQWALSAINSTNPSLFPNVSVTSEMGYVMAAYHINNWLQPALYYSVLYPNTSNMSGPANQQNDLSATLRFDINRFWLVKLEGHYMNGTAGLSSALNNNIPLSSLASSWGAFLLKTTGYF